MANETHAGRSGRSEPCPGCGNPDVLPGRVYCRPSCKAKHEHKTRPARLPGLLDAEALLTTELPPAKHQTCSLQSRGAALSVPTPSRAQPSPPGGAVAPPAGPSPRERAGLTQVFATADPRGNTRWA
jgi:hypothetical protein